MVLGKEELQQVPLQMLYELMLEMGATQAEQQEYELSLALLRQRMEEALTHKDYYTFWILSQLITYAGQRKLSEVTPDESFKKISVATQLKQKAA